MYDLGGGFMDIKQLDTVVDSLVSVLPLFIKKMIKPDKYNESYDLSHSHLQIIFMLDDMGKVTMSDIAGHLSIAKPNVTPLVQKLIDKELVERIRDEIDRRIIYISLTFKGEEFMSEHRRIISENLRRKLSGLSKEDLEELTQALYSLRKIITKIE